MKLHSLFFSILLFPFGLIAFDFFPERENEANWTLEVRGAYYSPSSKAIRRVYSNALIDYQVELAKRVNPFWEIWGGGTWAIKRGHSHRDDGSYGYRFKNRTKLSILPLNLGIKFIYPVLPSLEIYTGAGVSYSFLYIRNHCEEDYSYFGRSSSPFKKTIHKNGFGGVFKVGIHWTMSEETFLNFFADYYAQSFHLSRHNRDSERDVFKHRLDCSGFKFGAGFGVYF